MTARAYERVYKVLEIGDKVGPRTVIKTFPRGTGGRPDERVRWRCTCGVEGESWAHNLRRSSAACRHAKGRADSVRRELAGKGEWTPGFKKALGDIQRAAPPEPATFAAEPLGALPPAPPDAAAVRRVAERAGVSVRTVERALLWGGERIRSKATRDAVVLAFRAEGFARTATIIEREGARA